MPRIATEIARAVGSAMDLHLKPPWEIGTEAGFADYLVKDSRKPVGEVAHWNFHRESSAPGILVKDILKTLKPIDPTDLFGLRASKTTASSDCRSG